MPATLSLKTKGKILVSEGDSISEGQVLAEEEYIPQLVSLNIAKFFSLSPKKCLKVLTKKLGEEVKASEVIAKKEALFGFTKKVLKSPCDGVIERLEAETGNLIISLPKEKREIRAPVKGIIKKVDKQEITLSLRAEELKLKEAVGKFSKGKVKVITQEEVPLFLLNREFKGKIVCGKMWRQEVQEKAFALPVLAILGTLLCDFNWEEQKRGRNLLIGEQKETIFFNLGLITDEVFRILEKSDGKMAIFVPREKKVIIIP